MPNTTLAQQHNLRKRSKKSHETSSPNKQVATLFESLLLSTKGKDAKNKAQAKNIPFTLSFSLNVLTKYVESPTKQIESLLRDKALDPDAKAIVRATRDLIHQICVEKNFWRKSEREVGMAILVQRMTRACGLSATATFSAASSAFSTASAFSTVTAFFVHSQEQAPRGGIRISECQDCRGMITSATTQPTGALAGL